jgi:uncharacterized membrane protein
MSFSDSSTGSKLSARAQWIGVLSYLSPIGWILALILHLTGKTEYGSFHLRQSTGIFITLVVMYFVSSIPYLGALVLILGLVLCFFFWVVGYMGAIQGKRNMVPYLGPYFQEYMRFL